MTDVLRTSEMSERYRKFRNSSEMLEGCVLCKKEPIKTFTHWMVTRNDFPYDRIAKVHDMLVPKRHVTERELSRDEIEEFLRIKEHELGNYDYILEATHHTKTVPAHLHYHLIVGKV